jgi:hypothetical protein
MQDVYLLLEEQNKVEKSTSFWQDFFTFCLTHVVVFNKECRSTVTVKAKTWITQELFQATVWDRAKKRVKNL